MKKTTKMIISAIAILLVIIAVVILISNISAKKPSKAVENFAKELAKGNFTKAKEYTADDTFATLGIELDSEEIDMIKLYYKNLDVKVTKVNKAKDTAVVTVEITNKDLGKILSNYMKKAQELALQKVTNKSSVDSMEKELEEYFKSLFEGETIETISTTIDVVLTKQEGKWKVVVDDILRDSLLPGLYSATNIFVA